MSDQDEKDWLMKHGIRQFMKDQLSGRKEDTHDHDNSFIFLEKSTLNMFLMSMLANGEHRTSEDVIEIDYKEIVEQLEQVIAANKKDFEELITLLKKE
ncbi:hypothetical protein [Sporosarcina sp. YIM B06819]|uniref:hypothetical protein n=1 Tax=Sporosarcina sp. YIM B06819 TaxID=3081769 RepID=UPI00298BE7EF|nr:hypothetical protein [Sporosarcina sp. YIM B06819]